MSDQKRGVGKPKGAKAVSQGERDMILRGLSEGLTAAKIAAFLGRGRATVYAVIDKMRRDGSDGQGLLPVALVRIKGATDDNRAE